MKTTMTLATLAVAASVAAAQSGQVQIPDYLEPRQGESIPTAPAFTAPVTVTPSVVPAPAGTAVLGLAGLLAARRRRA